MSIEIERRTLDSEVKSSEAVYAEIQKTETEMQQKMTAEMQEVGLRFDQQMQYQAEREQAWQQHMAHAEM